MEAPAVQQSSVVVMLRALVMMACLIAIPLVALFGTSLPDVVKAVKEGRWPTLTSAVHALLPTHNQNPNQDQSLNQTALDEPAKFEPAGEPLPTGTAAMLAGPANVNAGAPQPALPPVAAAGATDPPPMAPRWTAESTPRQASAVVPAGYEAAADAPAHAAPVSPPAATTPKPAADPFLHTQQRLQQLGATYYLLESWGGQQQLYRFYCKMAVGGNPNYTRYFEAIESDPLRAMSQVLGQVESWRAGKM